VQRPMALMTLIHRKWGIAEIGKVGAVLIVLYVGASNQNREDRMSRKHAARVPP